MSFFPKIHECVIFISIFGQILNILADYGRSDKNICYSGGYCFRHLSELCQKEKKRNKPSRKKMAKPATVHVEPDIIMAGQQNECVEQSADNKLNKKRKGEGRKHRKLSEEALQKDALSTAQQPESGSTVRLKTPADARRAFIYSEIFNRKY